MAESNGNKKILIIAALIGMAGGGGGSAGFSAIFNGDSRRLADIEKHVQEIEVKVAQMPPIALVTKVEVLATKIDAMSAKIDALAVHSH